ncbi:MAG: KEOPS complex subunit Pcc1 [Candidatus Nitrosopelagicus sp.]|jgi:tRNA threonylcarbamoyladenosine modification (KEOPS) complex  Pcc1 subunit|nr:KEOPS complex subunit Pcc1 [Candidatus Nitrosopelagicus sp.]
MSQNCKVEIIINNISDEKAKVVKKSLEPDNIDFPDGLSLKVEKIDNKLVFSFSNSGNMGKLISTIDEVLEHANLALEVIK